MADVADMADMAGGKKDIAKEDDKATPHALDQILKETCPA